LHQVSQK